MADYQTNLAAPSMATSGGLNLSQSSITALAGSMSMSFSDALKSVLPMLVSVLRDSMGYINGTNRYTQQQFMTPLMGANAFTAHQANQAYGAGLVNNNTYLKAYAESMGFTGTPAQLSSYMARLPGGMERLQGGLTRAVEITQREYGMDPMLEARNARDQKVAQVYNTAASDFINNANKAVELGGGKGNFRTVDQVAKAIFDTYGDITSSENNNENWKKLSEESKQRLRDTFARAGDLARIRKDAVDADGRSYVDLEADRQLMADYEGPKSGEKYEAELKYRQMLANQANFVSMNPALRTFNMVQAADMAISGAMAFDVEAGKQAVAAGTMSEAEFNAKQSAQQAIIEAGGESNARLVAQEFGAAIAANPDSIMSGKYADAIEAGMRNLSEGEALSDDAIAGKKAHLQSMLGSDDLAERANGMQEVIGLLRAAGKEADATGLSKSLDMYGNATALAGGDQQAAQDMIAMVMSMNGKTKLSEMTDQDFESANRLVSLGATLGGPDAMAATMDQVTKSLESLGIATRDVTGKQTRLAGVLSRSSIEMQVNLKQNGGLNSEDAAFVANEAMQDLTGSSAGNKMSSLIGYLSARGISDEELGSLSEELAVLDPEQQEEFLRKKGGVYEQALNDYRNASDFDRQRSSVDALASGAITDQAIKNQRMMALRESAGPDYLDGSRNSRARAMLETSEYNEERFKSDEFKKRVAGLGYNMDDFDKYDAETQDFLRRLSGFDDKKFAQYIKANSDLALNLGVSDTDDVATTMKKLEAGGASVSGTANVTLPGSPVDPTEALAGTKDATNGLGGDRAKSAKAVQAEIDQLHEAIDGTKNFYSKVTDVFDGISSKVEPVMDEFKTTIIGVTKALGKLSDLLGQFSTN